MRFQEYQIYNHNKRSGSNAQYALTIYVKVFKYIQASIFLLILTVVPWIIYSDEYTFIQKKLISISLKKI